MHGFASVWPVLLDSSGLCSRMDDMRAAAGAITSKQSKNSALGNRNIRRTIHWLSRNRLGWRGKNLNETMVGPAGLEPATKRL